ncbi:MAG: DUF1343 domain-containing protein [Bacteroidetes bacterium]|nr:DUF1343 domain-containing protein [Bacteroidota bacterium]
MNSKKQRCPFINSGHLFYFKRYTSLTLIIFLCAVVSLQCQTKKGNNKLITGADRLISDYSNLLINKKIGVVFNQTSRLSNGTQLLDTLSNLYNVVAVFSPEHGFRGNIEAGKKYFDNKSDSSKIKFYSLYGSVKKPTKEMLKGIDILIYDLQDIGVRYYTYISTLFYVLEAAAENNITIIILDRPNPLNGSKIEGPILNKKFESFIGIAPIAVRYAMTTGELAKYFIGEGLNKNSSHLNLKIIKLKSWDRSKYFNYYYGNNWQKTSPNIPDLNTAIVYAGTCLIEGTNISEGRGTLHPFLQIGAPFINSNKLIKEIEELNIGGVEFEPIKFTPKSIPGISMFPKYKDEECEGVKIILTNREKFNSVEFGIKLVYAINKLYPKLLKFRDNHFNRLIGNNTTIKKIKAGIKPGEIIQSWKKELNDFIKIRTKYLIY